MTVNEAGLVILMAALSSRRVFSATTTVIDNFALFNHWRCLVCISVYVSD